MKCPVDDELLTMTERQGVEIDYCPRCRGVWLDRGELDKIIERTGPSAPAAPAYDDRRSHQRSDNRSDHRGHSRDHDPRRKKESFLSDLFDF